MGSQGASSMGSPFQGLALGIAQKALVDHGLVNELVEPLVAGHKVALPAGGLTPQLFSIFQRSGRPAASRLTPQSTMAWFMALSR